MNTKKLISILIALVMVVGMLPAMSITAFADDEIKLTTDIIRFNNSHTATSENGHYELSVKDHSPSRWLVQDDCPITIRSKDGQMISNISIKCDGQNDLSSFNFSSGSPSWDGNNLIVTGINADEFVCSTDYTKILAFTEIEFYTTHKHDFSDNNDCSCGVPREGTDTIRFDDGTATSKNHLFELNGSVIHDLGWVLDVNSPLTIRAKYGQRITRIDVVISHISFGVGGIITTMSLT